MMKSHKLVHQLNCSQFFALCLVYHCGRYFYFINKQKLFNPKHFIKIICFICKVSCHKENRTTTFISHLIYFFFSLSLSLSISLTSIAALPLPFGPVLKINNYFKIRPLIIEAPNFKENLELQTPTAY